MPYTVILKNISRFINLDETETDYFVSLLQSKKIKKNEFLLKPGDICRYEHFITKGCMRTYTVDNNGFEHILMFGMEDWWVGDLYSFLTRTPATYFIDALEETDILQISKASLDNLYKTVPKFERFFRLIIQNAFIAQQQRINQNLSFTAGQRYLQFVKQYPNLEQRLSQKQVAAYLGITPEFLSVLRRKLAKK